MRLLRRKWQRKRNAAVTTRSVDLAASRLNHRTTISAEWISITSALPLYSSKTPFLPALTASDYRPIPRDGATTFSDLIDKPDMVRMASEMCSRASHYRLNHVIENRAFHSITSTAPHSFRELVSSGRKKETGSDRFDAVLLRIRMRYGLRLWGGLRAAAYELHALSCASDWGALSFDRLSVA